MNTTCPQCHGAKCLRYDRDLGRGVSETVLESCPACVGELRDCNGSESPQAPGHQLITYRGDACPLCVITAERDELRGRIASASV